MELLDRFFCDMSVWEESSSTCLAATVCRPRCAFHAVPRSSYWNPCPTYYSWFFLVFDACYPWFVYPLTWDRFLCCLINARWSLPVVRVDGHERARRCISWFRRSSAPVVCNGVSSTLLWTPSISARNISFPCQVWFLDLPIISAPFFFLLLCTIQFFELSVSELWLCQSSTWSSN